MRLAVFDLDHTLLAADSDYLWGQFLCDHGLVERASSEAKNREFYADYSAGRLDVMLEKGAEALEREYDALTRSALALLEPAIILFMGGAVAVIVLSILLPILQLESLATP